MWNVGSDARLCVHITSAFDIAYHIYIDAGRATPARATLPRSPPAPAIHNMYAVRNTQGTRNIYVECICGMYM